VADVNPRQLATLFLVTCAVGCSSGGAPEPEPTVPTFVSPTTAASSTATTSAGPSLPAECGALLNSQNVDLALGVPLVGRVRSIVGVPEPAIKRLERVTCQYGLPEAPPPAGQPVPVPLEISVSVYADEASATERVADTVQSERDRGAAPTTVPVGPAEGTVLVTADRRLLVASSGVHTVAVTILPGIVDDRVAAVLADIGGRVLTTITN
jgi:hypothetical protein